MQLSKSRDAARNVRFLALWRETLPKLFSKKNIVRPRTRKFGKQEGKYIAIRSRVVKTGHNAEGRS